MGVTTIGSARIAPVFQPPVAPRLTEATLAAAGLPAKPYTTMHVDLVRASPKGKWHAPGADSHRCTHLTLVFGTALPTCSGPATDLRAWASDHGDYHWHLPQRWRWIPADDAHTEGPGSAHVLHQLCQALHRHTAVLVIAAGEPDTLEQVELVVAPQTVDPDTAALTYRPYDLPGWPTVTVPWRRIIALHDAW